MEDAQRTLMEKQGELLTGISSCQGFFPYKLFASDEELKEAIQSHVAADEFSKYPTRGSALPASSQFNHISW